MKGLVFTEFFEMVEEKLGFELVDQLIEKTELATGGATPPLVPMTTKNF
jgi:hypothetical protein